MVDRLLEHALTYSKSGIPVFPCRGKKPITKHGFKDSSTDPEQIRRWWEKHPDAQIGTPTGQSFWTLDVDLPDGPETLKRLETEHGQLPKTARMRTGGGGLQLFFKMNGSPVQNSARKIGPGVDVRGVGGYTILPPSGHPSGGTYQWKHGPGMLEALEAPAWLLDLVTKKPDPEPKAKTGTGTTRYGERALADEIARLSGAAEGTRNDSLNRAAFSLGQLAAGGELDRGTALTGLLSVGLSIGLEEGEARKTIESGLRSGGREPRSAPEKKRPRPVSGLRDTARRQAEAEGHEDYIDTLNRQHAVVMVGGQCLIMNEGNDFDTGRPTVTFSNEKSFGLRYRNWKIPVGDGDKVRYVPAAKMWVESERRREYAGVVFEPDGAPEVYYNLWKGFAVEPRPGSWSAMQDHILENICAGDPGSAEYVFAWMAHIVQNPGGPRPGTCLALRGGQGTGKGVFATTFGALFGQHFLHVSQRAHVVGRFNGHLKDTILLFGDESFFAGDKRDAAALKALITEPTRILEEKYVNAIGVKNLVNLILASNSNWVVPAELDERRFAVLDVTDTHQQDHKFFGRVHRQMHKEGGLEAMLHDLLEWKITVDPRKVPATEGLLDQKILSLESTESFWLSRLSTGTVISSQDYWPVEVLKSSLYDEYVKYCSKTGERHPLDIRQFGRALKRICEVVDYRPVTAAGERPPHYRVPNLKECRRQFERAVGMKMTWEEQ